MKIEVTLISRSGASCELCASQGDLVVYGLPPKPDGSAEQSVMICTTCDKQVENRAKSA